MSGRPPTEHQTYVMTAEVLQPKARRTLKKGPVNLGEELSAKQGTSCIVESLRRRLSH